MSNETFVLNIYLNDGKENKFMLKNLFEVEGDRDIEYFKDFVFNLACDGYIIEIEKFK